MNTTKNTVLITGGSAGIGLEIAKLLSEKGNQVIITGRNKERLDKALQQLPGAVGIQSDISREAEINALAEKLRAEHPALNVVVNNAGAAHLYSLVAENINAAEKAKEEIQTNYLSIIQLNEKLLPLLKKQSEAAIVNVSSVVAFVPSGLATYSASKAALHSYTQALRIALENTTVKVFELIPPLVNTEFSAPIGGKENGMPSSEVAAHFLSSFEKDELEIRVGQTEAVYRLFLSDPAEALKLINTQRKIKP